MSTKIYFDLDGTIYDLYGQENWLKALEKEDSTIFNKNFLPCVSEKELSKICKQLILSGVTLGVITWLPRNASKKYEEECAETKKQWVEKNLPYITEFHAQRYGTPKQKAIVKKSKQIFLIDDNVEVCKMWNTPTQRKSFNVNEDFTVIDALKVILKMIE